MGKKHKASPALKGFSKADKKALKKLPKVLGNSEMRLYKKQAYLYNAGIKYFLLECAESTSIRCSCFEAKQQRIASLVPQSDARPKR